jgi:thiamine-phosphate pyrophosphorylase
MERFAKAGLYVVTSQEMSAGRTTEDIISRILPAGVKLIQLREKSLSKKQLFELALRIRSMTRDAGALLIINDHLDVAIAAGADGVHLGQDDLPVSVARRLAPDLILGASSHSIEEAVLAEQEGASYVNIGPIYPTGTKKWTSEFLGPSSIRKISSHIHIPFTVMGGIKKEHIAVLKAEGAKTLAVVTAVTAAPDPAAAAKEILDHIASCG